MKTEVNQNLGLEGLEEITLPDREPQGIKSAYPTPGDQAATSKNLVAFIFNCNFTGGTWGQLCDCAKSTDAL